MHACHSKESGNVDASSGGVGGPSSDCPVHQPNASYASLGRRTEHAHQRNEQADDGHLPPPRAKTPQTGGDPQKTKHNRPTEKHPEEQRHRAEHHRSNRRCIDDATLRIIRGARRWRCSRRHRDSRNRRASDGRYLHGRIRFRFDIPARLLNDNSGDGHGCVKGRRQLTHRRRVARAVVLSTCWPHRQQRFTAPSNSSPQFAHVTAMRTLYDGPLARLARRAGVPVVLFSIRRMLPSPACRRRRS